MSAPFPILGELALSAAAPQSLPAALRAAMQADAIPPSLARILRPQAASRWLMPQIAAITPQYIEMVLRGALAGSHVQQWELFDLMLDSWPELAACAHELSDGVSCLKMIFEPFAEEDEDPTPSAVERCKLVSSALRRMAPDAAGDENDLEGTLTDLIDGWFRGVTALEIDWQAITSSAHGTMLAPRSTSWVHPVHFAFGPDGRLGLRLGALEQTAYAPPTLNSQKPLTPFPPDKFLLGIHKAKSGSALGGALLRPLAWWWCAANFSADWLLNLAQIFGLPFRWANYDPTAPQETVDRICWMLQNMGSAGWAAFPAGTTMELKDAGQTGDHSPQGELLDRADRYARLLILGQTMSGGQDSSKGGGKAFGSVESDVKKQRIEAAGRYACRVFNTQLLPSILTLNYGDADECPQMRLLPEEQAGAEQAQTFKTLADAGLQIGVDHVRKVFDIPAPAEGEETIGGAPEPEERGMSFDDDGDDLKSGDGKFHGNQWTGAIDVTLPDEEWGGSLKEMRARAAATMQGFTPVTNPQLGEVSFPRAGRGKTLSRQGSAHEFQAVQALPSLICKGRVTGFEGDHHGRPDVHGFHAIEGGLRIGKTSYRVQVLVKEANNGSRIVHTFYLHRLRHQHGPVKANTAGAFAGPASRPSRAPGGEENLPLSAADVNARLTGLADIEDDAVFAKELAKLIQAP